MLTVYTFF